MIYICVVHILILENNLGWYWSKEPQQLGWYFVVLPPYFYSSSKTAFLSVFPFFVTSNNNTWMVFRNQTYYLSFSGLSLSLLCLERRWRDEDCVAWQQRNEQVLLLLRTILFIFCPFSLCTQSSRSVADQWDMNL